MSGHITLVELLRSLRALADPTASIDPLPYVEQTLETLLKATSIVRLSIDLHSTEGSFQRSVAREGAPIDTPILRVPVHELAEPDGSYEELPLRAVGFVEAATPSPPTPFDSFCVEQLASELGRHARALITETASNVLETELDRVRYRLVTATLKRTNGRAATAARILGVPRSNLYLWLPGLRKREP